MLNIKDILAEGRRLKTSQDKTERAKEPQALRAGNSGILVSTDKEDIVYGECARKAHLRYLQIEETASAMTQEIFDEGTSSEPIVNAIIQPGLDSLYPGHLLMDGEFTVATTWQTSKGTPVTGRPDGVIVNKDNVPVAIIEHKKKISYYSMRNSSFMGMADNKHLVQAAHYSWQLGNIPAYIIYRSGSIWHWWAFDRKIRDEIQASPHQNGIEYKDSSPSKIMPHYSIYTLTWEDGIVYVEYEGKKQATLITADGIRNFYDATDGIREHKELGPRPSSKSLIIGNKSGYSPCGLCAFKPVCDAHEHNYETWLDHIKVECDKSAQWTLKGEANDGRLPKESKKQRIPKQKGG